VLEGARVNRRSGRPTSLAFSLEGLAGVALAEDRPAVAARALAVAAAARGSTALPATPALQPLIERMTAQARGELGNDAFERVQDEARGWSLTEALDRSLEELAEPAGG
jgi:hypothetical protein